MNDFQLNIRVCFGNAYGFGRSQVDTVIRGAVKAKPQSIQLNSLPAIYAGLKANEINARRGGRAV